MTLVWLSPGLPADRAELAAALPPDVALVPASPSADPNAAADVGVLPVGSLCVATVFEHDLLAQLASRPAGVRLLVVGPPDRLVDSPHATAPAPGRPADVVTAAASVPELVTAIQQAAGTSPTSPFVAVAPLDETPAGQPEKVRTPLRTRLIAAAAVLVGLAVGGVVIGATEGTSAATANGGGFGGFGGGNGGGFGQFPGAGGTGSVPGGAGGAGGSGGTAGTGGTATAVEKEMLACLRKQGIKTPTNQLLQNQQDPALRQAFITCIQQLRGGAAPTGSGGAAGGAGVPGGGPGGPSSQITGRP